MAGIDTSVLSDHLIRSQLWSTQLKDVLYADLQARGYVRWLSDFPDGTTFNIPSIGTMSADDYAEGTAVEYTALDTGNFQFEITEYVSSATFITNKSKQDSMYSAEVISQFVPKMSRALDERLEAHIWKQGQPGSDGGQTVSDQNLINGIPHRWVAQGTSNSVAVLGLSDFAQAKLALQKANVPMTNLIAIVDPGTEYVLNTLTNLVNVSNNPMWEGVITSGLASGMRFSKNIFGFDVYVSNFLPLCGTDQSGTAETINSVAAAANSRCNLFFSAASDIIPYVGAWRQMPNVESEYNKDFQREEYVVTARYGVKLFRPENFVTIISADSSSLF